MKINPIPNPKISVIIPFYGNQCDCVLDAVKSIASGTLKNLKFILIDNASTAGLSQIIKTDFPDIKLIENAINLGVTGGRNAGIKNLYGDEDFVMFFDSDQVAHPKMLEELIKPFYEIDDIGITTPKIYFHPDFLNSAVQQHTPFVNLNDHSSAEVWAAGTDINMTTGQILFRGGKDSELLQKDCEVNVAPAVLCCSIEVVHRVGLFDESYFATYEDTDYCFRAKNLGYKIFYCAKAFAWHEIYYDPKGSADKLLTRLYYVGRNRIIFMRKFAPDFTLFLFFLPVYFLYYTWLGLKYKNLKCIWDFYKGTFDGFRFKIKSYGMHCL